MSYQGPTGTRLCPVCANFSQVSDPTCRSCGYNFDTGEEAPADASMNVLASQNTAGAARSPAKGVFLALFFLAAAGVGVYFAISGNESASVSVPDIDIDFDFEQPDLDLNPGPDFDDGGAGAAQRCRQVVTPFLRQLLANGGQGERPPAEVITDAANKLGALTSEFDILIDVYQDALPIAFRTGSGPAIKRAQKGVAKACRAEYG